MSATDETAAQVVSAEVGRWLDSHTALALAANHPPGEQRHRVEEAVETHSHQYLAGFDYDLAPAIVAALRQAGLLAERNADHA